MSSGDGADAGRAVASDRDVSDRDVSDRDVSDRDVKEFGALFWKFLTDVVYQAQNDADGAPLSQRLEEFLGASVLTMPVVTDGFEPFEHATVQVALDAVLAEDGTTYELFGVGSSGGRDYATFSEMLQQSAQSKSFWTGAVEYASVQISYDEVTNVVAMGVYLVDSPQGRLAVMLRQGNENAVPAQLEVLAPTIEESQRFLERVGEEREARNLLRRQVISFAPDTMGPGAGPVRFHRRPEVQRDDVVMPGDVLDRVERQVAGIARHRDRLRAEGRHLKRGVLLYGPPGTGKTHTVRWLTSSLEDFTVVLLIGPNMRFIRNAAALARQLQPALVVFEDVDLIAEDRDAEHGGGPLLYAILDELDGLTPDADVTFLLTTNRVDVLEPALAQRPGRVDLSVEVPLPDEAGRRRLLELYGRGVELTEQEADRVVQASAGVPASFLKEVVRRATLLAAEADESPTSGRHVMAAADELLSAQEALTRRTLGERNAPAETGNGASPPAEWFATPPVTRP